MASASTQSPLGLLRFQAIVPHNHSATKCIQPSRDYTKGFFNEFRDKSFNRIVKDQLITLIKSEIVLIFMNEIC